MTAVENLPTAVADALNRRDRPRADAGVDELVASFAGTPTARPVAPEPTGFDPTVGRLPDDLWTAHPTLDHVRRCAWARLLSPEAVLAAVLARTVALSPHVLELPGIVGGWAGPSLLVGLIGASNVGKSTATRAATELLPTPAGLAIVDCVPVGSGEGLVELLFGTVTDTDENGKPVKVRRQTRHNVFVTVDEGAVVADLANRSGSTLAPTLRGIFSHATVGQSNASSERNRVAHGESYVYGLVLGLQPDLAGPLLADAAAGTPQRFVWSTAHAPRPPDAVDPGPLDWAPLTASELRDHEGPTRGGYRRAVISVADVIAAEIRAAHLDALEGAAGATLPEHHNLRRLKVAAALALLTVRQPIVDSTAWDLAGSVMAASTEVLDAIVDHLTATERAKHLAADRHHIDRTAKAALASTELVEERALASATRSAAKVVAKHADTSCPNGCTRRCITTAMAGKHRRLVTADDVIEKALERDWIAARNDRFWPGESRPA